MTLSSAREHVPLILLTPERREEDTGSKRMDEVEYSPSGGDDEDEHGNDFCTNINLLDNRLRRRRERNMSLGRMS